jgi:hypothetical protein
MFDSRYTLSQPEY